VFAPVLDAFGALTKRARARAAESHAAKKAAADKKPPTA
jgi:hypothetical protein